MRPLRLGPGEQSQGGTQVLTRPKLKVRRPSLYKVILLNDDFTPMDFVVHVLRKLFGKSEAEASQVMLQVHHQGSAIAGIYTFEVAETKVFAVNELAKKSRHPLKCVLEAEGGEPC